MQGQLAMSKSTNHTKVGPIQRGRTDGLEPVTDYDSKTVMMVAERHDNIEISGIVTRFDQRASIPREVTVIQRTDTYYGPELLVHAVIDGDEHNFRLNAPGPDSHLCLWAGEMTEENRLREWFAAAEVKASMSAEQPPYENCEQCGEEIRTIEHERESLLGRCSRVQE